MHAEIDLLPDEFRRARINLGRAAGWTAVIAVLAVAIAFTGVSTYWRQADARAAVAELQTRVNDMSRWTAPLPGLIAEIEAMEVAAAAPVDLIASGVDWERFLVDLSLATSDALRLNDIDITAQPAETGQGGTVVLAGVAENDQVILRFLRDLETSSAVDALDLDMSSVATGPDEQSYNLFSIRGVLARTEAAPR